MENCIDLSHLGYIEWFKITWLITIYRQPKHHKNIKRGFKIELFGGFFDTGFVK